MGSARAGAATTNQAAMRMVWRLSQQVVSGLQFFFAVGLRQALPPMKRTSTERAQSAAQPKRKAPASAAPTAKKVRTDAPHLMARPQPASFPRGGGTGLSPIEYRQSVLEGRQASSDLFSERTGLKKKALRPKKKAVPHELQEERVRVELLNYKVRVPRHVD